MNMATERTMDVLNVYRSFGEALCFFRKRAQLTQDELGRAVGYSRTHIALMEGNRRKPDPSVLAALFLPALGLTKTPHDAERLLKLAAAARSKSLKDFGIKLSYPAPPAQSRERERPSEANSNPLNDTLAWYIQMDPEAALKLANALEPMWATQKNFREARTWLSRILALSTSATVSRAEAILNASRFAQRQHDPVEAMLWGEQALAVYRAEGDAPGTATTLSALGWAAFEACEMDRAAAFFQEGLAIEQTLNRPRHKVDVLLALVHLTNVWSANDARRAEVESWLHTCESLSRETGYVIGLAHTLRHRGALEIARSSAAHALALFTESLGLFKAALQPYEISWGELSIGEAHLFLDELDPARLRLNSALAEFRESEQPYGIAIALHHTACIELREGNVEQAQAVYTEGLRRSHSCGSPYMVSRCIAGLAEVALAQGHAERAAHLLGSAHAQFDALPPFLAPYDLAHYQRLQTELRNVLGSWAFEAAWATGRDLPPDEVMGL